MYWSSFAFFSNSICFLSFRFLGSLMVFHSFIYFYVFFTVEFIPMRKSLKLQVPYDALWMIWNGSLRDSSSSSSSSFLELRRVEAPPPVDERRFTGDAITGNRTYPISPLLRFHLPLHLRFYKEKRNIASCYWISMNNLTVVYRKTLIYYFTRSILLFLQFEIWCF